MFTIVEDVVTGLHWQLDFIALVLLDKVNQLS